MDISKFIIRDMEQILVEWESFAQTFGAVADKMSSHELRGHAKQILQFVAEDKHMKNRKDSILVLLARRVPHPFMADCVMRVALRSCN